MLEEFELYASCAQGLESVLASELKMLKAKRVRPLKGGVSFYGDAILAQKACLWLRSASRVELVLGRGEARDAQTLYECAYAIDWQVHFSSNASIKIFARGANNALKTSQFVALKTKDALCDYWIARGQIRPRVDLENPDVRINVHLHEKRVRFSLDLSGESLHKRGYRNENTQAKAPLKENLAAGLLLLCDFHKYRKIDTERVALFNTFIDPLCGTGTLAIEGALIACNGAPGLLRKQWGFFAWKYFDISVWNKLKEEAINLFEEGKCAFEQRGSKIFASDKDPRALAAAQDCALRAGVLDCISFSIADVKTSAKRFAQTTFKTKGLLLTNPPYAIRLSNSQELSTLYKDLSQLIECLPQTWELGIITADAQFTSLFSEKVFDQRELYNGPHRACLYRYRLADIEPKKSIIVESLTGRSKELLINDPHAQQFASRLRKCAKERRVWAQKRSLSAYRVYDKDLPDFAVSIDLYFPLEDQGTPSKFSYENVRVAVCEYKAPRFIDEHKAQARIDDVMHIVAALFDIPSEQVFLKTRQKSQGGSQYGRESMSGDSVFTIQEFGHPLKVDLSSFLDTGIFLDHRPCRWVLQEYCADKSLLNLFSYTSLASLHAASKGATTVNVDLSQTYLQWGRENYKLNKLETMQDKVNPGHKLAHEFVRADILRWVKEERKKHSRYDCIFLDPPTFSNSKAMHEGHWDVQRDHAGLIEHVLDLLKNDGVLIFSCNLQHFKLNYDALNKENLIIRDVTELSIPYDFQRSCKIHHCFVIGRSQKEVSRIEDLFSYFKDKDYVRV